MKRLFGILALGVTALGAAPAKWVEGDILPQVQLINQDKQPTALHEEGRWTVMTFIFTRCAVMDFCPRMSGNFREIQAGLAEAGLSGQLRMLSISLDPTNDTPELLREYGVAVGAEFDTWDLATGDEALVAELIRNFRVVVQKNGVTLDHTLCTALVSPKGRIAKVWRGNGWKPSEVIEETSRLLSPSEQN